jgi:hypothetical protein
LKLLVDHNLPPQLARCLQALFKDEHEIVALSAKFPKNVDDVDWMAILSKEGGWAVLTRDLHILTRPHERRALDNSRVVYFFLAGSWRKMLIIEMASRLIRLVPKMAAQVNLVERGRFELPVNAGSRLRQQR